LRRRWRAGGAGAWCCSSTAPTRSIRAGFAGSSCPGCPPALLARRPKLDLAAELAPAPDIIAALLGCFMREIDDAVERAALEIFAVLRTTTPPLLQSLLGSGDAGRAFAELRRLSFTYSDTTGIYPHDVVREVLLADLRQRQLERLRRLQLAARAPAIVAIWCAASPRWPTSCGARAREISASGCAPR
jgi:hypothetical protein